MFNEQNTVENLVRDLLCGAEPLAGRVSEPPEPYAAGRAGHGLGWHYVPALELPRRIQDVFVEAYVRDALIRLNPTIAKQPERVAEVLYKLRAIVLSVRSDGLIRANEEFTAWLRGERSMPFGPNYEHVTIRLVDFDNLDNNQYLVTTQYTFRAGGAGYSACERRADLMLLVNGLPLVLVEAKTPVRDAVSWVDGVLQVHNDYERFVPELFACNVFSVATEGKDLRYGAVGVPIEQWGPWRATPDGVASEFAPKSGANSALAAVKQSLQSLLRPTVILDILAHLVLFATDKQKLALSRAQGRRLKIVCRYQQYEAANQIVERVLVGWPRKGLIWHFQGSGKSLLMIFAAQKLRLNPAMRNPAVLIVVDRIDLDAQISATFHAADIPNLVKAESREDLERLLRQDIRKIIIITTIFKFGEAEGVLNERENLIVMVDEAHRTQEGDLGLKMRAALPNAFLFGLTGTPINRRDRNTFYAFGAPEDARGYMSRYGFEESIRDGATLPLHFEPRLIDLHIDKDALDQAYAELTGDLSDLDRENLAQMASKMAVLVKLPERVSAICGDIAHHFQLNVQPNGFKGMVVTFDQESCLLYKAELDKHLPPEASEFVISVSGKEREDARYRPYKRNRDAEEALLDRYRDPNDLLQAIARTNRTYGDKKTHGLIVDYLGVFDDIAKSLEFDEEGMRHIVSDIANLKTQLPAAMQKCLGYFAGVDRTVGGYEGLIRAQECLPNNEDCESYFFALNEALLRFDEQSYHCINPTAPKARVEPALARTRKRTRP